MLPIRSVICVTAGCLCLANTMVSGQVVWYVDDDQCPGVGSGSEADPFCRIQDAIAASDDGDTVRVAPGTYVENIDFLGRSVTVVAMGGPVSATIWAADVSRVVTFNSGEGPDSVLDGFMIAGGSSGGILCKGSSPTIRNCLIADNEADTGAGIDCVRANPKIMDCEIRENVASSIGGGIKCTAQSHPTITRCTIADNEAENGAGLYIVNGSRPIIRDCLIADNRATGSGGGVANGATSQATFENCTIAGNTATVGAGMNCGDSSPTITNCVFEYNIASETAGGINCEDHASPTISNCTFRYNKAIEYTAGAIKCSLYSNPTISNSNFYGNSSVHGGGMYIVDNSSPIVRRCAFVDNTAFVDPVKGVGGSGGGVVAGGGDPLFDQCIFRGNRTEAGAGIVCGVGNPTITNSMFQENEATQIGGGITVNDSNPTIVNCHLIGNTAGYGGGAVYSYNAMQGHLINCTISMNIASHGGAIWAGNNSHSTLTNCIVWDNGDTSTFYEDETSTVTVTYSDVQGGFDGTGNINVNPLFFGVDYLRLGGGSPCIDRGSNAAVPTGITIDFEGLPRFSDDPFTIDLGLGTPPIVDMGASEYRDCNYTRIADIVDVINCTGEGLCVDENANGIPDTCEVPGDLDFDGYADLPDAAIFMACLTGPTGPFPALNCPSWLAFRTADLNTDLSVDLEDAAAFMRIFQAR